MPCPEAPRPRGAGCPSAAIPRSYARRVLLAGLGLLTAAALASLAAPTPPAAPARYREGFDHEALLEPGRVYKLAFPVGWMSQVFNAGHRIGVTVASTGAPLYEPNPRTGRPLTIEFPDDAVRAVNTIHHGAERASRMIAPVTRGQ